MFLKISEMELGKVRFRETFAPGIIDFSEGQLRQADPVVSAGTASLSTATMEIRVSGHLATRMEGACDRCLEMTSFPLDADFDLVYRPAASVPERAEVLLADDEAEIGFYEGEGLELADVLREQVLLLLPMHRVCSEDCKGICPVCGQNRNQTDCTCRQQPADDRWAGLRNL